MEKWISKSQFKARALEYFRNVQRSGTPIVITEHGRPVLRVTPFVPDSEEALRVLRGSVIRYDQPTEPVALEDWESLR